MAKRPGVEKNLKGHTGSVNGHAPTYPGNPESLKKARARMRELGYGFDQEKGKKNRAKGNRPFDKEARCLQEIQNGQEDDKVLLKRFAPRLIRRVKALLDTAEDSGHKDFIHANRMIQDILGHRRGPRAGEDEEAQKSEPDSIEVTFGRVEIDMPGAAGEEKPK